MQYSIRNLNKSRSRSLLTIFSIFVGITTLFIFISFGFGLYSYVESFTTGSSVNKILVQARASSNGLDTTFKLTDDDLKEVQNVAGIKEATPMYMQAGQITQDETIKYVFVMGYDPDTPLLMDISDVEIVEGRWLRSKEENSVILGYNYLLENKIMPDAYGVGDRIEIDGKDFRIAGFLSQVGNTQDDSNIYMTIEGFESFYPNKTSYAMIVGEVEDVEKIDEIVERTEEKLRRSRNQDKGKEDFYVQSFNDLIESFSSALNIVIAFIILIALISVLVSAVNTANTMITSVLERYREIGIIKAIGARNSEIFKIFLFESAILGFVAGCIGVFFGWVIVFIADQILNNLGWGFLSPSYSPAIFIGCILFATITGAISGFFPARNAAKTNTVNALRYE